MTGSSRGSLVAWAFLTTWVGQPVLAQEVRIGELTGPDELIFGRVTDVGADSLGTIVVIDAQLPEPRAYSATGAYLGPLGSVGEGPGEFMAASTVGVSRTGRVAVTDPTNARITLLQLTDGSAVVHGSFRPGRRVTDLCWLGDRLFAVGHRGTTEPLIVEFDISGRIVKEFGERIIPTGELGAVFGDEPPNTLNNGKIACDEASGTVAYASLFTGEIRLYSNSGSLVWATTPPGWTRVRVQRTRGGFCCQFGIPEEGFYHQVRGLMIDGATVGVSTELIGTDGSEFFSFRAGDGALLDIVSGTPFYHARLPDGRRIGHRLVPFSHVLIGRE